MSLLDQPEAQALRADAEVSAGDVRGGRDHLTRFLNRDRPLFDRRAPRGPAAAFVRGLLSGRERTSIEPIAHQADLPRTDLQDFVGCGAGDDEQVRAELRRPVRTERADDPGVLVLDPSAVVTRGTPSGGVARPGCGRLGTKENCPIGVFLASVSDQGHAPRDRRLDRPKDWAHDPVRRKAGPVPEDVSPRKTGEIAQDLRRRSGSTVPHGWVVGDDEFGRARAFRAQLRADRARSVLDGPCPTTVRDRDGRRPRRQKGRRGPKRKVPFLRVDPGARKLPAECGTRWTIGAGAQGPLDVEAVAARVCAPRGRRIGPEERWVVLRTRAAKPEGTYCLSNAAPQEPRTERVRMRSGRHRIEEVFEQAKGAVGLAPSEVGSGVGGHHHVTRALRALGFLVLERRRLGGEHPGGDGGADAGALHRAAPGASPDGAGDRRGSQSRAAA